MTPCLHCDPSSTHISALLALRLFFIFAPRRALSEHLFRLFSQRPVFLGLCRFPRGGTPGCPLGSWVWLNCDRAVPPRSNASFTRLSPGIPWKPDSRSISRCPLTTAHAIWRNRLEPPGYEPGGTHPRAHERVYGPQNTSMASFERLIAAPCSTACPTECMCRPPIILTATPSYPDLRITSGVH